MACCHRALTWCSIRSILIAPECCVGAAYLFIHQSATCFPGPSKSILVYGSVVLAVVVVCMDEQAASRLLSVSDTLTYICLDGAANLVKNIIEVIKVNFVT